jgi:hypothetical protein
MAGSHLPVLRQIVRGRFLRCALPAEVNRNTMPSLSATAAGGPPRAAAFHIGDMLDAYDALRAAAPSPQHIVPGHDPLVMRRYPAPSPFLESLVVRLDVMRLD